LNIIFFIFLLSKLDFNLNLVLPELYEPKKSGIDNQFFFVVESISRFKTLYLIIDQDLNIHIEKYVEDFEYEWYEC